MIDFIKQNKLLSGGILVALLVLLYYFVFASGGAAPAPLTETDTNSPVSQDLLVTLSNLRSIELSNTIFSDPVFVSLSDFGVAIPQEPVGRRNPFLPYAATSSSNQSASSIKLPATH